MLLQQLKEYMFENDLSATKIAQYLGISAVWVGKLISGKRKMSERVEYKIRKFLTKNSKKDTADE